MLMTLVAVLAITISANAQEKVGASAFYSSENSIGLEVIQAVSAKPQTALVGFGASWANKEGAVFVNAGYDFGLARLVSRTGLSTNNTFLYGGYAGINVTKRIIYTVGYDTKNKYTTGLTFVLN